ncbi:hypothetical protein, partial [Lactiplantibacillus plantarum]
RAGTQLSKAKAKLEREKATKRAKPKQASTKAAQKRYNKNKAARQARKSSHARRKHGNKKTSAKRKSGKAKSTSKQHNSKAKHQAKAENKLVTPKKKKELAAFIAKKKYKYTPEDVLAITRGSDGKLYWLEKGNDRAGLKHILKNHEGHFVDRGVTKKDIPKLLDKALRSKAIKRGVSKKGPYADYNINGKVYRVAYGDNGFVVSFYPM